jgi:hypothetical protein
MDGEDYASPSKELVDAKKFYSASLKVRARNLPLFRELSGMNCYVKWLFQGTKEKRTPLLPCPKSYWVGAAARQILPSTCLERGLSIVTSSAIPSNITGVIRPAVL